MGMKIAVKEKRRIIMMDSGQRLDLHNVTAFDCSGSFLRLWCDEEFVFINKAKIDWMIVKSDPPSDEQ